MNAKALKISLAVLALSTSAIAGAATRTSMAPSKMMNLTNFKLTIPVDAKGNPSGLAATIDPRQLAGSPGYSSKWFYVDSDGAVVFYCPSNGATTTPGQGSDHARSELRELYKLTGPTEWTNKVGGSMSATLRINKAPAAQSSVTIGQIHGLSALMTLLTYDAAKKQIVAKVYPTPTSTRANSIVLATGVPLGVKWNYTIQWIGSTLSISVNGKATNWVVDASWNNVPVYFKAGAYSSAPNSGNADGDATEVAFYDLQIQH